MEPQACKLGTQDNNPAKPITAAKHFGMLQNGVQRELMLTTCGKLLHIQDGKYTDLSLRLQPGDTPASAYDKIRSSGTQQGAEIVDFC